MGLLNGFKFPKFYVPCINDYNCMIKDFPKGTTLYLYLIFPLWCWRSPLRVPWTARRSNQSILKEINPEYSLEGLMLKAPILWPSDVKSWLTGKILMLGKTESRKSGARENQVVGWHHRLNGYESEQTSGHAEGQGILGAAVHGVTKSQTLLSN